MKNLKTFESFVNEEETPKSAELPKGVLYNQSSRTMKKGTFSVNIEDDTVSITYDRTDKSKATIEFNKDKVSYSGKGDGLAIVQSFKGDAKDESDMKKSGSPALDPKAKSGDLLADFYSYSGQLGSSGDISSNFTPTLCKILRALSVSENYKTKTTQSFKSFMAGIYSKFNTDVFAGVKDMESIGKKASADFKKEMEIAIKEMPSKKA